jgi:glycosyltransferase involved in cell wall biosynthesis
MAKPLDLGVVIPVYNEEECIAKVILDLIAVLEKEVAEFKILCVNDGSKDNSLKILTEFAGTEKRLIVIDQPNGGHGKAIRRGYEEALKLSPEYIFQCDSDDQFELRDFCKLWEVRERKLLTLGIRLGRQDPLLRRCVSKIITFILFSLGSSYIPDPNIPFRLVKRDYLGHLLSKVPKDVFAPNVFISALGGRESNLQCIGVRHKERATGEVSIKKWKFFKVVFRSFYELIVWRFK